jgi:general stress protein 26
MTDTQDFNMMREYIDKNSIGVLGTTNDDGTPHGAAVYLCADDHKRIVYVLTKDQTKKFKNLTARDQVSLTVLNPSENSTLQANGHASVVDDPNVITEMVEKTTSTHASALGWMPPLAKIEEGEYKLVAISIDSARLARFDGMAVGSERIFTTV